MAQLKEGVRLIFVNEFAGAEETLKSGAHAPPPAAGQGEGVRDARGAFALVWTLVSLMFGLLSFANDQLDECLERVWIGEKLVLQDTPWAGQRMLLGMVYLIAGIVQAAKNAWLKAGVNFVRALRFIREFEGGLNYEGPERPLIRSVAQFFLGLFNFVLSMLPPNVLKMASRAGGQALKGDRQNAMALLSDCHKEEEIMAPFAVLVLLAYNIAIKTYLGEETTPEDVEESRRLLDWAADRFPGSAIFGFWETEFQAARKRIADASQCAGRVHDVLRHLQLPAVDAFLEQKKAFLSIALLEWQAAADGCEQSLAVSMAKKRRSYVPYLSYVAGLCRLLQDDMAGYRGNFDRIAQYSRMKKRNWPPEDELAFIKGKEYAKGPFGTYRALLDLVEVSMLKLHLLHTMPEEALQRLSALLEDAPQGDAAPEEAARALLFRAELARLRGDTSEARRLALAGVAMAPKLGARGASNGTAASLHLLLALLGVEGHLEALDRCPKACKAFDEAVRFKQLGVAKARADGGASSSAPPAEQDEEDEQDASCRSRPPPDHAREEDEFFSADEGDDSHPASQAPDGTPERRLEVDVDLCEEAEAAEPSASAAGTPLPWAIPGSPLNWASQNASKALRSLHKTANKAAQAITVTAGALIEMPGLVGGVDSGHLYMEALHQQATQGDCSIVEMPFPRDGASEDEIMAYLRWAHWSSLRGMPEREALLRHKDLKGKARGRSLAALV